MVEIVGIQFDNNIRVYYFNPQGKRYHKGERVIVNSNNGLELVTVSVPNKKVKKEDVVLPLKNIERKAIKEDFQKVEKQEKYIERAIQVFNRLVKEEKLELKLVSARYSFDGSQITFRYTADNRVDFRELVKKLARELNRRIEMRQINMREKASMIGGVGPCGYDLCCRTFLNDIHGSTIKMVKNQKLSLIPERISGVCDKLLCCLRYEDDMYTELSEHLPDVKQKVVTPDGEGQVVYVNVLSQKVDVVVKLSNGNFQRKQYPYSELRDVLQKTQ